MSFNCSSLAGRVDQGFRTAAQAFDVALDDPVPDFQGFHEFVARRLGQSHSSVGWCQMLLEEHRDEVTAFHAFFELLQAYRARLEPPSPHGH